MSSLRPLHLPHKAYRLSHCPAFSYRKIFLLHLTFQHLFCMVLYCWYLPFPTCLYRAQQPNHKPTDKHCNNYGEEQEVLGVRALGLWSWLPHFHFTMGCAEHTIMGHGGYNKAQLITGSPIWVSCGPLECTPLRKLFSRMLLLQHSFLFYSLPQKIYQVCPFHFIRMN